MRMIEINEFNENDSGINLLPAWFIRRMASDMWYFGLIMTSGDVIGIQCISSISEDGRWIDATMIEGDFEPQGTLNISGKLILAPTKRTSVSIQVQHIMGAIELAYT
jgi:hypothetical protein